MNVRPMSEWVLYRWRFIVAYASMAVVAIVLLTVSLDVVPPGLGPSEQQSIVQSSRLTYTALPTDVTNLPYHALQKATVEWLGVTPLGVRLPSIIFGLLTALCVVLLLRRWFKPHVAIAAGFIFITAAWFLSVSRLGAPIIMIPFWTSLLLLTATYVSQQTGAWKWWRVAFALAAALSMYTPYMAYLFIAAGLASLAQPHLRYILRETNPVNVIIGGFFFILALVPLGWGVYQHPSIIRDLLGVPATLPDPLEFAKGLVHAISNIMNPYNTSATELLAPLMGLATFALLVVGCARLLRDFHSVRAHVLLIWAALLVPVIAFNPTKLAVLLVPAEIVVAIGLNQIVRYWYRLFPRNPYARLFGLIPLAVLIMSIVQFNYQRYTFAMLYSPQAGTTFNSDAFKAQAEINSIEPGRTVTIVVDDFQKPLYEAIAKRRNGTGVSNASQAVDRTGTFLVHASQAGAMAIPLPAPSKLLVNDLSQDALRFIVYQK